MTEYGKTEQLNIEILSIIPIPFNDIFIYTLENTLQSYPIRYSHG